MTPNPNPSPELIERLGTRLTAHLSGDRRDDRNWPLVIDAGDLAEIVAVFSQTLPTPVSHASQTTDVVSHGDGVGDSRALPAPGEVDVDQLASAFVADYVMSTEGNDYVPTEWEGELIADALHGFIADHWPRPEPRPSECPFCSGASRYVGKPEDVFCAKHLRLYRMTGDA
ncbi:hypothetical protein [Sphingomonas sp. PP-CC-1A-547]|uniref:hypothetical protein n=1 Tax=Sphingomonas sp. PP-CC-1A-547 TaxID=2135654 RepID=UPI0011C3D83D|nr:hypothetical protein [Sphingomonas sp. PP-CC-1A-547]